MGGCGARDGAVGVPGGARSGHAHAALYATVAAASGSAADADIAAGAAAAMANGTAARRVQVAAHSGIGGAGGGTNGHAARRIILSIGICCVAAVGAISRGTSTATGTTSASSAPAAIGAARVPDVLVAVHRVRLDVQAVLFVAGSVAVDLVAGGRDAGVVRRVLGGALQMVVGVRGHAQREGEATVGCRRRTGRLIVVSAAAHRHAGGLVRMAVEAGGLFEVRVHSAVGGENFGGAPSETDPSGSKGFYSGEF